MMEDNLAHPYNRRRVLTINDLPDEVLLAIFDFYVFKYQDLHPPKVGYSNQDEISSWQSLVHVCRLWRGLVFASHRRLNLQLCCTTRMPARKTLDVWPALPLLIHGDFPERCSNNVIAEPEHRDRIRQINLFFFRASQIENLLTAMQVPFLELAGLFLYFGGLGYGPVLPDSFLGGSAPRLRTLALTSIPYPGLPKLLLSATHLVKLFLHNIPHSGYISPEAMSTCLSMLTRLETLQLGYESALSSPDNETRLSCPPTRSILPALTTFIFKGVNEYLEELVTRIDTPRLCELSVIFFNDIDFDTPELIRLVSRSSTIKTPDRVHVSFNSQTASVKLQPQPSNAEYFEVTILRREPGWQLSTLTQICTTFLPLLSTTEDLFIYSLVDELDWKDGVGNIEWLQLLLPFTAVKNFYISKQFAPRIALALQEMTGGGTTEVLSTLQNLYLEGLQPLESVQEGIERFMSARQLLNRPVAISVWDRDFKLV